MADPRRCTGTTNVRTGAQDCPEPVAGFAVHVLTGQVSAYLDGGRDPEVHLLPRCWDHLRQAEESDARLIQEGPSELLVRVGMVGAAVGTLAIVQEGGRG